MYIQIIVHVSMVIC